MTGHWLIETLPKQESNETKDEKSVYEDFEYHPLDRIAFDGIKDGGKGNPFLLIFRDQRKFGKLEYFTKEELDSKLSELGPDVVNDKITKTNFRAIFRKTITKKQAKTKLISNVLLDQRIISGIGNYMRADILYHSKLSPYRTIEQLSDEDIERLRESCRTIAKNSAKAGGHTISNYFLPTGEPGSYKALVYGKEETDNGVKIQKDTIAGRSIYWSPSVQK
eukprot:CAMPEP_0206159974 /NCGR_PEP_ID=MMETSP1474-20131121/6343_1 /ASSEMBLY_ACC=CAM_ASM_001110 /TAXON_ID=97495 /ORGANISM="Imantonia sp., Strain RCC918" /LENGTH=220 /DNA_ID=CAMNT_0053561027 /DNA_START=252 /DNA_END=914 /DNA_ORIENTATION=-